MDMNPLRDQISARLVIGRFRALECGSSRARDGFVTVKQMLNARRGRVRRNRQKQRRGKEHDQNRSCHGVGLCERNDLTLFPHHS